ncbi:hypothetical protein Tco_1125822 [Tanacetum coccineum]
MMASLSEDINSAGSDSRPPMLDRSDFESWQQRIRLYCKLGKNNGDNILKSIDEEPDRVFADLTPEEKERFKADIRATNILLKGSELTKDERESQLYDEFEHFRLIKGETIHEYYLNSKFVNNMFPEWGRFVTAVKLNRGLKTSNNDQLYAYLKQHDAHANKNKMMLERYTQHAIDPLALVSNVSTHQDPSQSSAIPQSTYVPLVNNQPQFANNTQPDSGLTLTDDLIENLTKIVSILTQSYKTHLPQTNNQLRTSSNTRNQATVKKGRVVVQNV